MNRYKIQGEWSEDSRIGIFVIQSADIIDVKTGHQYREGAFRVMRKVQDGIGPITLKPAKKGKGGTVPFFGETAWSDAERLARDLALEELRR